MTILASHAPHVSAIVALAYSFDLAWVVSDVTNPSSRTAESSPVGVAMFLLHRPHCDFQFKEDSCVSNGR